MSGEKHLDTALCASHLASIFQEQGKYRDARTMLERSLDIYKTVRPGPEPLHPEP